jgi:hypothetical protein
MALSSNSSTMISSANLVINPVPTIGDVIPLFPTNIQCTPISVHIVGHDTNPLVDISSPFKDWKIYNTFLYVIPETLTTCQGLSTFDFILSVKGEYTSIRSQCISSLVCLDAIIHPQYRYGAFRIAPNVAILIRTLGAVGKKVVVASNHEPILTFIDNVTYLFTVIFDEVMVTSSSVDVSMYVTKILLTLPSRSGKRKFDAFDPTSETGSRKLPNINSSSSTTNDDDEVTIISSTIVDRKIPVSRPIRSTPLFFIFPIRQTLVPSNYRRTFSHQSRYRFPLHYQPPPQFPLFIRPQPIKVSICPPVGFPTQQNPTTPSVLPIPTQPSLIYIRPSLNPIPAVIRPSLNPIPAVIIPSPRSIISRFTT